LHYSFIAAIEIQATKW